MTKNKRFRISQGYTNVFCHDWEKNKLLNFKQTIDCLNTFYEENEQLKKILGAILLEVKRDISNTNQTGEIRVFINPNSFNLISEVLRKYGALKEWYE